MSNKYKGDLRNVNEETYKKTAEIIRKDIVDSKAKEARKGIRLVDGDKRKTKKDTR